LVYRKGGSNAPAGPFGMHTKDDRAFAFDYEGSGRMDHIVAYTQGTGVIQIMAPNLAPHPPKHNPHSAAGGTVPTPQQQQQNVTVQSQAQSAFPPATEGQTEDIWAHPPWSQDEWARALAGSQGAPEVPLPSIGNNGVPTEESPVEPDITGSFVPDISNFNPAAPVKDADFGNQPADAIQAD